MLIGAVIAAIGTTLQTAAQDLGTLIAGRLIAGIAIGVIYFAIPQCRHFSNDRADQRKHSMLIRWTDQSEIAPADHRLVEDFILLRAAP